MAQLYLPLAHTESDLVLAGQIAELIDSAELYVTWTPELGRAVPEVVAELRAAVPQWSGAFALILHALRVFLGLETQRRTLPPVAERPAAQPKPAA